LDKWTKTQSIWYATLIGVGLNTHLTAVTFSVGVQNYLVNLADKHSEEHDLILMVNGYDIDNHTTTLGMYFVVFGHNIQPELYSRMHFDPREFT
jgi:hypothetical protein